MRRIRTWFPYREHPGLISKGPCWVWFANGRMFTGPSLYELFIDALRGWNDDRWLIG